MESSHIGKPTPRMLFGVVVVWLLYFLDFVARFGVAPLYPLIQNDLALSDSEVGLLGSAVLFGMAAFVLPLSYIADRWSRRKFLAVTAIGWSVCSMLSGLAGGFLTLIMARIGLGIGEASFAPAATSLLTSWFRRSRWGLVLGTFNTAVSLGIFLGSVFSAYMANAYGWRTTLIAIGIPGIVLGLMALWIPDKSSTLPNESDGETALQFSIGRAIAVIKNNRSLMRLLFFYGLVNMAIVAIVSWMPMYLIRAMGMSISEAAKWSGAFVLTGVIGYPLGGFISDRLAKKDSRFRLWLPAMVAIVVAACFSYGFATNSLGGIFLGAFLYNFINPSLNATTQEVVPASYRSMALGVVIFGMQVIGMFGPWLTGVLSQNIGLVNSLISMQIAFVVCFFGFLLVARSYRTDCRKAQDHQ